MRADDIPVMILCDASKRSWLSIETVHEEDGFLRLFKEFSNSSFKVSKEILNELKRFLDEHGANDVRFEDNNAGTLGSILKKLHYLKTKTYDLPKKIEIKPIPPAGDASSGMTYFGIGENSQLAIGDKLRKFAVLESKNPIGSMVMTDYGRFVRAKANKFGSEGFGMIAHGKDPSIVLAAVAKLMLKEGKRYMILGPEYAPHVHSIHPFFIWHMTSSGQRKYSNNCIKATKSEVTMLSKLVSEYDDTDIVSATSTVLKNMENPAFKYIISRNGEGFSLLKFMENAEGKINDLYVSPQHQGKGIGDELARGAISVLSENCLNMNLNTIYPRAKRLYQKYGFAVEYMDYCVALNQKTMVRA